MLPADSPRLVGEDTEHIRVLAESDGPLPRILVHRASMRVIDGMHRLGAARLRGQDTIDVRFFDGSEEDAFVMAVRANVSHGLPLSFADREAAAVRIFSSHPQWSDRAIAAATGLGARTVGAIRQRTNVDGPQGSARIGRDGRVRPVDSADGRRAASQLIADHPEASLREVARAAGISPTTARDVRERMHRGDDPVPSKRRIGNERSEPATRNGASERRRDGMERLIVRDWASVLQNLKKDPSLRFTESGRRLLRWLFRRAVDPEEWHEFVAATPPHCVYVVSALARRCADEWLEFAEQMEQRVSTQPSNPDVA